jgi:hypothetical protein
MCFTLVSRLVKRKGVKINRGICSNYIIQPDSKDIINNNKKLINRYYKFNNKSEYLKPTLLISIITEVIFDINSVFNCSLLSPITRSPTTPHLQQSFTLSVSLFQILFNVVVNFFFFEHKSFDFELMSIFFN